MQNAECKMQNAECRMQNAKCRTDAAERGHSVLAHCAEPQGGKACKAGLMQNAKLFFLPKLSNFPKFSKSKPSQEHQKLEFKQMVARLRLRQEQSELAHFALP